LTIKAPLGANPSINFEKKYNTIDTYSMGVNSQKSAFVIEK
jgi:hypothetical protein